MAARLAAEHGGALRHAFKVAIKGFSATLPEQAAKRLAEQNPSIAYYERNGVAEAIGDVEINSRGGAKNPGSTEPPQVIPYGVLRVGGPVSGIGRHAWVIDTSKADFSTSACRRLHGST